MTRGKGGGSFEPNEPLPPDPPLREGGRERDTHTQRQGVRERERDTVEEQERQRDKCTELAFESRLS